MDLHLYQRNEKHEKYMFSTGDCSGQYFTLNLDTFMAQKFGVKEGKLKPTINLHFTSTLGWRKEQIEDLITSLLFMLDKVSVAEEKMNAANVKEITE